MDCNLPLKQTLQNLEAKAKNEIDWALVKVNPKEVQDFTSINNSGLICHDTLTFRQLAQSKLNPSDLVVEIGCSFGVCTTILKNNLDDPR